MNEQPFEPKENVTEPTENNTQPTQPTGVPGAGNQTPVSAPPPRYDYLMPEEKKPGTGFAVASLVTGILSLVCCCVLGVPVVFGILAIVFAVINKKQAGEMNGMALAGLVCGIAGAALGLLLFAYQIVLITTNPNWMEELYGTLPPETVFALLFH